MTYDMIDCINTEIKFSYLKLEISTLFQLTNVTLKR